MLMVMMLIDLAREERVQHHGDNQRDRSGGEQARERELYAQQRHRQQQRLDPQLRRRHQEGHRGCHRHTTMHEALVKRDHTARTDGNRQPEQDASGGLSDSSATAHPRIGGARQEGGKNTGEQITEQERGRALEQEMLQAIRIVDEIHEHRRVLCGNLGDMPMAVPVTMMRVVIRAMAGDLGELLDDRHGDHERGAEQAADRLGARALRWRVKARPIVMMVVVQDHMEQGARDHGLDVGKDRAISTKLVQVPFHAEPDQRRRAHSSERASCDATPIPRTHQPPDQQGDRQPVEDDRSGQRSADLGVHVSREREPVEHRMREQPDPGDRHQQNVCAPGREPAEALEQERQQDARSSRSQRASADARHRLRQHMQQDQPADADDNKTIQQGAKSGVPGHEAVAKRSRGQDEDGEDQQGHGLSVSVEGDASDNSLSQSTQKPSRVSSAHADQANQRTRCHTPDATGTSRKAQRARASASSNNLIPSHA